MLTIWGRSNSVNVQKVMWACEEMQIAYERIDAGAEFGVVNTPQYRSLNPNGLVPTIEDAGFVMWESNAILRYLCAKHSAGKLWPQELILRAEADMWMDWENSVLWPALRPLFWNLVRTPVELRDIQAMENSRLRTGEVLGYLDDQLRHRHYVAGADFSMGDIPVGCAVWRWYQLPVERPALPHLERWFELLCKRPGFQKVVALPLT